MRRKEGKKEGRYGGVKFVKIIAYFGYGEKTSNH